MEPREPAGALEPDFIPQPLPVGQILGEAFSTYVAHVVPFTLMSLVAMSPVIAWGCYLLWDLDASHLLSRLGQVTWMGPGLAVAAFVLEPLATGAMIYAVFQRKRGQRAGLGRCLAVGFKRLLPLLAVTLLTALGMIAIAVPAFALSYFLAMGLGILALFLLLAACIPLFMFLCASYLAGPAVVVEKIGPITAFRRSFRLTSMNRGRIFGVLLVIGILKYIADWIAQKVFMDESNLRGLGDLPDFITGLKIYMICALLLSIVFGAISASAAALAYHHVKVRAEGADAEQLAAIFD